MNRTLLVPIVGLMMVVSTVARADLYPLEEIIENAQHAEWHAQAINLMEIHEDLTRVSGVEARLLYSLDPDINAYATETGEGEKVIVVMDGLIEYMKHDRDAVAAVIGHELAHHKADHIHEGRKRQDRTRAMGSLLGAVAGIAVGYEHGDLAGAATETVIGVSGGLVALSFSRGQEYEADQLGMAWLIEAGYNPAGMLRVQEMLGEVSRGGASMLSTHPNSEQRFQRAQRQIQATGVRQPLLALAAEPLVDELDLSLSIAAVASEPQQMMAAVQAPAQASVALAAHDSGVSLATYAAIQNHHFYAGSAGRDAVLESHGLDDQAFAELIVFYNRQMEDERIRQEYTAHYYRATRGTLSDYGRDLFDHYKNGQALAMAPPIDVETMGALRAEMGGNSMSAHFDEAERTGLEAELLAPLGWSFYDYTVALAWWSAKAAQALQAGDPSLFETLYTH